MKNITIDDLCHIFSGITLDEEKGCWLCSGSDNGRGYIQLYLNKKNVLAHRFMYRLFNGEFPNKLDIRCSPGSTLKKKKGQSSDQFGDAYRIDWRIGPCENPRTGASRAPTRIVPSIG